MWGSEILDVAIGMVLIFLLLSVISSAIREAIETVLKTRSVNLEAGIRELLNDPRGIGLARAMYNHPLIQGLYRGSYDPQKIKNGWMPKRSDLPSYIPSRNFALALLDIAARGPYWRDATSADGPPPPLTLDNIRATVSHIDNPQVQRVLLTAIDTARGNLAEAQASVADWFDSGMDRVSGWYKRETQLILLGIGIVLAVAANVDTLAVAHTLYRDENVRAQAVVIANQVRADSSVTAREAVSRLENIRLPIGWPRSYNISDNPMIAWPSTILGWMLTALAVSLGAPFWFDLLNKVMVIRSTVKPHEKSPEEGSEDRQPKKSEGATVMPVVMQPARAPSPTDAGALPAEPSTPPAVPAGGFERQAWANGEPDEGLL